MSEPDISNLARNLAEQNNVDWRNLTGTGPDGRVVERDVLDYLARVMAGEEAVDPTPEPLPEGMEAWPDQDAPAYFTGGVASQEQDPDVAADSSSKDPANVADYPVAEVEDLLDAGIDEGQDVVDELLADDDSWAQSSGDFAQVEAVTAALGHDDDDVSADIFLFDDEADGTDHYASDTGTGSAHADEPDVFEHTLTDLGGEVGATQAPEGSEQPDEVTYGGHTESAYEDSWSSPDGADDTDEALLVADDELVEFESEPQAETASPAFGLGAESQAEGRDEEVVFDAPLGTYDQDFITQSERLSAEGAQDDWAATDIGTDLAQGARATDDSEELADGPLPDLWAGDPGAVGSGEVHGEFSGADGSEPDEAFGFTSEASVEDHAAEGQGVDDQAADDVEDLEQAEALDEIDAVADLEALDGDVDPEPAAVQVAAAGGLPLARTGNVLRRHVDLSGLAGAQLAAGQELGHDEPIGIAPFLLRAAAKAVSELGGVRGQVALAQLGGELSFRRVDDAAGLPFATLVAELDGFGAEEDELGLAVVDLSGYDMDELLLDLDVPALTLGRVLYDTHRGAHRSTLSLSGAVPLDHGAKLLARVAELLDAPVRLLI